MTQLVYQVCNTKYQVSFYLWRIGPVLKHCKVPKYYYRDCRVCIIYCRNVNSKTVFACRKLSFCIHIKGKNTEREHDIKYVAQCPDDLCIGNYKDMNTFLRRLGIIAKEIMSLKV